MSFLPAASEEKYNLFSVASLANGTYAGGGAEGLTKQAALFEHGAHVTTSILHWIPTPILSIGILPQ